MSAWAMATWTDTVLAKEGIQEKKIFTSTLHSSVVVTKKTLNILLANS